MNSRITFIILILITLNSCKKESYFQGNFATCAEEGHYTELNVRGDSLRISTHRSRINRWTKFRLDGDTLYALSAGEWIDSVKPIIKFKNRNKFQLDFLDEELTSEWYRITKEISDSDEIEHKQGILQRFKESDCYLSVLKFEKDTEYIEE